MKVGIVGARGIGKHHAKWYARAGCEVVAIYGTSEESAAAAAAGLRDLFGFTGRAYHDWGRFRAEGGFEAVSVCSPAHSHRANVLDLAADGKHLLCEKPLAWNTEYGAKQLVREAGEIVAAAERAGVLLAVNAQYPGLLDGFRALHRTVTGREPEFQSIRFTMQSKGQPRTSQEAEVWIDLGPHPLAVIDSLAPGAIDWETLRSKVGPGEALLDFDWVSGSRRLTSHIECRRVQGQPLRRSFGNQDLLADYDGCTVDGDFSARLSAAGHEWIGKDPMRVSVERFVEAVQSGDGSRLLVSGEAGLRQHEALVGVWQRCWPEAHAE